MKDFATDIMVFRERIKECEFDDIPELINELLEKIKYSDYIKETEDKETADDRLANIDELFLKAAYFEEKYIEDNPEAEKGPTLQEFLNDVSLVADIDNADTAADRVLMMTLHSAKGLEFSHVYIVGMEDGLFPGDRTVMRGCRGDGGRKKTGLCRYNESQGRSDFNCRIKQNDERTVGQLSDKSFCKRNPSYFTRFRYQFLKEKRRGFASQNFKILSNFSLWRIS